jgi:hypothetical protein
VFAATALTRYRRLGVAAPGPMMGFAGAVLAAASVSLSALFSWAAVQSAPLGDPTLAKVLSQLWFATGAFGFAAPMGLLVLGLSVPAVIMKFLPAWLAWAGMVIGVLALLSTFGLITSALYPLIPVGRFGGLLFLLAVAVLLPHTAGTPAVPPSPEEDDHHVAPVSASASSPARWALRAVARPGPARRRRRLLDPAQPGRRGPALALRRARGRRHRRSRAAGRHVRAGRDAAGAPPGGLGGAQPLGAHRRPVRLRDRHRPPGRAGRDRVVRPVMGQRGRPLAAVRDSIAALRERDGDQRHTPVMIAAGGPKALELAAETADIVAVAATPTSTHDDVRGLVDVLGRSAGDRMAEIELALNLFLVGDDVQPWMRRFLQIDPAELHRLNSPGALRGTPREMADQLLRRRDELGVTYYAVAEDFVDTLAPVVEALAGS